MDSLVFPSTGFWSTFPVLTSIQFAWNDDRPVLLETQLAVPGDTNLDGVMKRLGIAACLFFGVNFNVKLRTPNSEMALGVKNGSRW